jgi:IS5 family transposase
VIYDATACPQDIAYPTDLDLLSDAREKSEHLIDLLYDRDVHKKKPRTYRKIARTKYLQTAQKKNKTHKAIRSAVGNQLRFLRRNLKSINKLLNSLASCSIPLEKRDYKYLLVITTLYQQQKEMYDELKHTIEDRIVSIHQPHVRPIVRGKTTAKVEFGAKIHVSIIDGISFLDEISWDAFNEGSHMMEYVEKYKERFGCYPRELLADQIYCTRANRSALKEKGIKLLAKPLGRPSAVRNHVSPGERNPIEGKFGQAKTAYGLNRIKARLQNTSESWIACIILVLNLVKLAGAALPCALLKWLNSFSARDILKYPLLDVDLLIPQRISVKI